MCHEIDVSTHSNAYGIMIIYYLYVKTHKITGLKYLGQTSLTYPGSGIDWTLHLKEFWPAHETEILIQTVSKEDRNNWGRYYSTYFNVVNAQDDFGNKIWANRIPETGGGGPTMTSERALMAHQKNPQARLNRVQTISDPKINAKFRKSLIDGKNNSITKELMSKNNKGSNNPTYDHTLYSFKHKSGLIEKCTQYELRQKYNLIQSGVQLLVKHKRKTHKGWSLVV